jgi:hypothetical protein
MDHTNAVLFAREMSAALSALGAPSAQLRELLAAAIDVLERGASMPEFQNDGADALKAWATALISVREELESIERIAESSEEMSRDAALALETPAGASLH